MKKIICSILLVSAMLLLFGCGKTPEESSSAPNANSSALSSNDFDEATNVSYTISDFTFQAPKAWTHEDNGVDSLITKTGYMTYEWFGDLTETEATDQFIDDVLHGVSLLYTDYQLTSGPTRQTVGGCNGFSYTFQYTYEGSPAYAKGVSLFDASGMITFTLFDLNQELSHLQDFDAVIATLTRAQS